VPIYEFICHDCGAEFEKLLSFSSTITPQCPTCQSENVKRQMGLPAVHFKGSGWYINDSKKSTDSKKAAENVAAPDDTAKNDSSSSTESSTPSEGVAESKKSGTESASAATASVSE